MTKTRLFICFVVGMGIYQATKYAIGMPVSFIDMFNGVYWTGATLLVSHFLVEPA